MTIDSVADQQTAEKKSFTRKHNFHVIAKFTISALLLVKLPVVKIRGHLGSIVGDSFTSRLERRGTSCTFDNQPTSFRIQALIKLRSNDNKRTRGLAQLSLKLKRHDHRYESWLRLCGLHFSRSFLGLHPCLYVIFPRQKNEAISYRRYCEWIGPDITCNGKRSEFFLRTIRINLLGFYDT